jgi:hypothetical protein
LILKLRISIDHGANLAEHLDDTELGEIKSELVGAFEADRSSRSEWEETYIKGLDLLGLKIEERTTPWPGACGVFHPVLSEAVIRFQAEAIMETFPAKGPVRTQIVGDLDGRKGSAGYPGQDGNELSAYRRYA